MRGHFLYLRFNTFPMTPITLQCEVFWALLSNSKHSGVQEDSKSPTLEVLSFTPTLGQSGVATMAFFIVFSKAHKAMVFFFLVFSQKSMVMVFFFLAKTSKSWSCSSWFFPKLPKLCSYYSWFLSQNSMVVVFFFLAETLKSWFFFSWFFPKFSGSSFFSWSYLQSHGLFLPRFFQSSQSYYLLLSFSKVPRLMFSCVAFGYWSTCLLSYSAP